MMTPDELAAAIAYHRRYHRPELFAPEPGQLADCQMATCQEVRAELMADRDRKLAELEHEIEDSILAALEAGDGSPAATVAYHLKHCAQAGGAIVMHHPGESADDVIARLLEAGWTLREGTDHVAGKRIRYVTPPQAPRAVLDED
jgi:hypothetical protein